MKKKRHKMMRTILLMILVSLFLVTAQLLLSKTLIHFKNGISIRYVLSFLQDKFLWMAICSVGIASVMWMYVISFQKLSIAYPMISFSYVLMTIATRFIKHEPISLGKSIGIALICAGVFFLFQKY
jgi:undecaprenyl phosphate-alpha-L-ara4N flippase subunit ArnE